MSIGRIASCVLLSTALVATACNETSRDTAGPGPGGGASRTQAGGEPAALIDLSGEAYSLPSGVAFQGGSVWVSNYVNGGSGPGAPIIYRYDPGTGRAMGSIPSPSDWTGCLASEGAALLVTDYVDGLRLFRLSPETGAVLSSFALPDVPACFGIAWDRVHFYVGEAFSDGARISKYSESGEPCGVVYARTGSPNPGSGWVTSFDTMRGLAYADGTLWVLVTPSAADAPYRLLQLSAEGAELSSVELAGTAGRDLNYLGHDGRSFWTIEYVWPMSLDDFSWGKRLVRLLP